MHTYLVVMPNLDIALGTTDFKRENRNGCYKNLD